MGYQMNTEAMAVVEERRSANYHPNIWDGDRIRSLRSNYTDTQRDRHEELKQAVQRMLDVDMEPLDKLSLIDDIQRLGVAYHFEKQINDALDDLYSNNAELANKNNLHAASLYFRLIRQHGCYVSSDIFIKFKDGEGGFKPSLSEDVDGLLSLYEASYLGIKGETILDEAKAFSTSNLKKLMGDVEAGHARRIEHALDLPLHWRMIRVEARHCIDVYEENKNERSNDLLEFAKLDFNMVQSIHQKELKDLSIWWDSIDLARKLGFVRDRLMESFLLSVGVVFEPKFSECRMSITKDITFITAIDDIYDVYGSLDELELFTDAVNRWDLGAVDRLPEYMKLCYLALFNTTNEMAYITLKKTGWNVLGYLKKLWAMQCNTYLVEAQWFHQGYIPTMDEYLNNAKVTIGVPLVLAHTYTFTQQRMTKDELDRIDKDLKLISWSSLIFRLFDDLGTSKAEQQRGDVSKSIQCYMHETGVSEEVAREHIKDLISDAWKGLNEESLKAASFGRTFVNAIINGARAGVCTYQHGDGYGVPDHETKGRAMSLFLKPIPKEADIKLV
ncbi:sesquiterpene synthase TPS3-like [Magnolia sinica]|uniref:sesquiterpene synthase TPS3-like n=1 Tax=Magnolia sinica TaxID=86752 RepID=UPI002659BEE7|nr:sesquiterpene synthase TPS3-like [Magnolia sinica]